MWSVFVKVGTLLGRVFVVEGFWRGRGFIEVIKGFGIVLKLGYWEWTHGPYTLPVAWELTNKG